LSELLEEGQSAELIVGTSLSELKEKIPSSLYKLTSELLDKLVSPIEYLDI